MPRDVHALARLFPVPGQVKAAAPQALIELGANFALADYAAPEQGQMV